MLLCTERGLIYWPFWALFMVLVPTLALANNGLTFADYNELQTRLNVKITFEEEVFPDYSRRVDGLYRVEGATLGERFRGQALTKGAPNSSLADFDVLSNTAAAPLVIQAGRPRQNLSLRRSPSLGGIGLFGEAWKGFPRGDAGGEGAVSIFFAEPQFGFGFRVKASKADGSAYGLGVIQIVCFNAGGARVGDVVFDRLRWNTLQDIACVRSNGQRDIKGCSITNTDPKGVIYDDFIFAYRNSYV